MTAYCITRTLVNFELNGSVQTCIVGGRLCPPQPSMQKHTLLGLTHTQCGTHTFVRCIPKSYGLGTRILCRHKHLKNFSARDLPNGVGTECPSLWYSGQSRRGRTCRRVRTDMHPCTTQPAVTWTLTHLRPPGRDI